jgi:hypothetical protein
MTKNLMEFVTSGMFLIALGSAFVLIGGIKSSMEQNLFQKSIADKSDEIGKLNQKIASLVTGGDSFCYIAPVFMGSHIKLIASQRGEFPVYGVTVQIVDLDNMPTSKPPNFHEFMSKRLVIQIGDLPPQTGQLLTPEIDVSKKTPVRLNLFFFARNGSFTETFRMNWVAGKWVQAIRVTTLDSSQKEKVLHEQIDPLFPKDANGQVVW